MIWLRRSLPEALTLPSLLILHLGQEKTDLRSCNSVSLQQKRRSVTLGVKRDRVYRDFLRILRNRGGDHNQIRKSTVARPKRIGNGENGHSTWKQGS